MIIRGPRPSDTYALVHTAALADGGLSFKARGILAYLLSCPNSYSTTPEKLAKAGTDGERAVKSGLKELEDAGYLVRNPEGVTVTDTPGVGAPTPLPTTPDQARRPAQEDLRPQGGGWKPSEQAVKTAHECIELMDIPLSITHYRIRAAELKRDPTSGEWLRWLIEDEKKARTKEREDAKSNGHHKPWFAVAGD